MAEAATEDTARSYGLSSPLYGKREMRPDPMPPSGIQLVRIDPNRIAPKAQIGG